MLNKSIYFFICCFFCNLFHENNSLRWIKSNSPDITKETVISLSHVKYIIEIDVSRGIQVTIIRDQQFYYQPIIIHCLISGFVNNSRIEYSFCKNEECSLVQNNRQYNMNIAYNYYNPNIEGLNITMKFTATNNDYSGSYYCKAKNNNFEIRSNNIEIRDRYFWSTRLFSSTVNSMKTDIKSISTNSLPQLLNCSNNQNKRNYGTPEWINVEFLSPVFWSICPVLKAADSRAVKSKMNFNKCIQFSKDRCDVSIDDDICPYTLDKAKYWSTFVTQNGDLVFTDIISKSGKKADSFTFLCYSKDEYNTFKSHAYFFDTILSNNEVSKGITISGPSPELDQVLQMVSQKFQEFILYARKVSNQISETPVTIYAFYKSSSKATYTWKLDNVTLHQNNNMHLAKYTITFINDISSDQAGKYTLEVEDKSKKIVMVLNVKVLGLPILVNENCLIPLMYVPVNGTISISCSYKQSPKVLELKINDQEIKLGETLENNKANLKQSNPYLEMLSFSVSATNLVDAGTVTMSYTVFNLIKSKGQTQYQDHIVTFIVKNDFGMSVKTSSIYVIPDLKTIIDYPPNLDSCTNICSSKKINRFNCKVRVEEYNNKDLRVEYYWTINSQKLGNSINDPTNKFAPYFQVDHRTKELTMNPIISNNTKNDEFVKKALFDNFIECHINIYASNREESNFFYTSTSDSKLGTLMKAKIRLDYVPMNTSFIYWIVIAILLVVFIIIITLLYLKKNKGKVYLLDKLERKHGYNPENELNELIFKPYERQDHENEYETQRFQDALNVDEAISDTQQ